jgi:DNA-binding CsgD family transcriptional regulator
VPHERPLTPRERHVVTTIAEGHPTTEAARQLGITPNHLQAVLRLIYLKLGLRGRGPLVRWAFMNGLMRAPKR